MSSTEAAPTISVQDLTYTFPDHSTGVRSITLALPPGSRTLLVGANGAGKTTLLRLLAGTRLAPLHAISVGGLDPFQVSHPSGGPVLPGPVTYLGLEWALNPLVRRDVPVTELLRSVGADAHPARRDALLALLDVDPAWRLHAVSDGERRRVQLAMGLVRPWSVLLLDEVTVDLDVLARAALLAWLREETEARPCTVVYASHILDSLAGWPTHLVHMHLGSVKQYGTAEAMLDAVARDTSAAASGNSRLGELVLGWLREDRAERGPRGALARGPEGKTYGFGSTGIGGYGDESKPKPE